MAKHSYQKSRKEYKCSCCGEMIEKGVQYVKVWNFYNEYKVHTECYRKAPRSRWETSEYRGIVLDIQDDWDKNHDIDSILSSVEDLFSDLEYKYDNMPEQLASGSLVEERKDIVEQAVSDLEDLQMDLENIEEPDEDDYLDEEGNLKEDEYEDAKDDYENELEDIYSRVEDVLFEIDI